MNNEPVQKILLGDYLAAKGPVKSLMHAECEIFGIPYPLEQGWPVKYRMREITPAMLSSVSQHIAGRHNPAADKTRMALMKLGVLPGREGGTIVPLEAGVARHEMGGVQLDATSDFSDESNSVSRVPPWEDDDRCNQATIDFVRHLLARCERGEVVGVTVIEHLPDGSKVVREPECR